MNTKEWFTVRFTNAFEFFINQYGRYALLTYDLLSNRVLITLSHTPVKGLYYKIAGAKRKRYDEFEKVIKGPDGKPIMEEYGGGSLKNRFERSLFTACNIDIDVAYEIRQLHDNVFYLVPLNTHPILFKTNSPTVTILSQKGINAAKNRVDLENFDESSNNLSNLFDSDYNQYRLKVDAITESNYITYFDAINPNGVKRGTHDYHIDHIVPVKYGYENGIPPEIIAHPSNLQMLHWQENNQKGDKLLESAKPVLFELTQLMESLPLAAN